MDRDKILTIVNDILESKVVNKETYFEIKYSEFKEQYPNLFRITCEGKIDKNNLDFMMGMLAKMENTKLSQYDASAEVGTMLYKKYVEPKLNL